MILRRGAMFVVLVLVLPSALAGDRDVRVVPVDEAGYAPYVRFTPRGFAGSVDWLLVTPAALVEAVAPLVEHRRRTGLAAEVVTCEEVARDVLLGGGDFAERLRNLVRAVFVPSTSTATAGTSCSCRFTTAT